MLVIGTVVGTTDAPAGGCGTGTGERRVFARPLKVLALNVAHGRKGRVNQLFLGEQRIRSNLSEVAAFLRRVGADVVALQEADGPSRWSGNFDHVALLAEKADYPWHARAGHARSWLFDFGTAVLSRREFTQRLSHAFSPSPPTVTKGLLLGQIAWQPKGYGDNPPVLIDVVSVHLDFSRVAVRRLQIAEMSKVLASRENHLIVLGDFNSEWSEDASAVREFAHRCSLHAYKPLASNLGTSRMGERRLDWILISSELEFRSYTVLPDIVSDHYAVTAEVALKDTNAVGPDKACGPVP